MTQQLPERYGKTRPATRRGVIVASGLIGVLALTWLIWAMIGNTRTEATSALRSFKVNDAHSVSASVAVDLNTSGVRATCLVRAFAADHSVVGEVNFPVSGSPGTASYEVDLRTEREATSVEVVGCTTQTQRRPR